VMLLHPRFVLRAAAEPARVAKARIAS